MIRFSSKLTETGNGFFTTSELWFDKTYPCYPDMTHYYYYIILVLQVQPNTSWKYCLQCATGFDTRPTDLSHKCVNGIT